MDNLRVRLVKSRDNIQKLNELISKKQEIIEQLENEIQEIELSLMIESNTYDFIHKRICKEVE